MPAEVPPVPSSTVHAPLGRLVDELIDGLIASHDLSTSDAQRTRIATVLHRAGVTVLHPEPGDTFDPGLHRALATEGATNGAQPGCVARTERPGWQRDSRILRPPEVVVWR